MVAADDVLTAALSAPAAVNPFVYLSVFSIGWSLAAVAVILFVFFRHQGSREAARDREFAAALSSRDKTFADALSMVTAAHQEAMSARSKEMSAMAQCMQSGINDLVRRLAENTAEASHAADARTQRLVELLMVEQGKMHVALQEAATAVRDARTVISSYRGQNGLVQ